MNLLISQNLAVLRRMHGYTLEQTAEKIGVTRQAVAKWESGETLPDLFNCDALARLYEVSLDDLLHYDSRAEKLPVPPKGKHLFGTVTLGERGQLVLPKKARDMLGLSAGDLLMVLGNEDPDGFGLALVPAQRFLNAAQSFLELCEKKGGEEE